MASLYEFGEFRLDPDRRLVWRGNGAPLELAPRAFDALLMMISHPGELIEKAALMSALWPNVTVVENSLDQIVSRLRRTLGDVEAEPLIATDRGRGYRFVGAVKVLTAPNSGAGDPPAPRGVEFAVHGGTQDAHALQLYVQGRVLSTRPSPDNLRAACELFRAAFARDDKFVLALAHLALMRTVQVMFGLADANTLEIAEREAKSALEAVPDLARGHQALANVSVMRGKWIAAKDHFDAAARHEFDRDASVTRIWQLTVPVGHLRLAFEQALSIDELIPAQPLGAVALALSSIMVDRDQDAARYADVAEALGWPRDQTVLRDTRAVLALRAGRYAEAKERMITGLSAESLAAGGAAAIELVVSALQNPALAGDAVAALRASIKAAAGAKLGLSDWITQCLVMLGAVDDAFALINEALDRMAKDGMVGLRWGILWSSEMRPFRRDPRFWDLVERIGLPDYWRRHGPPDGYELGDGTLREISG